VAQARSADGDVKGGSAVLLEALALHVDGCRVVKGCSGGLRTRDTGHD